jgi:LPPG:FO 2-phospho-L-lactate transferase
VIGNTGDDVVMHGLRICPDLDSVMYTLGGGASRERGWGREDESFRLLGELAAYGAEPSWFGLGDLDIATHLVRTSMLAEGRTLVDATTRLCERWQPGVTLLPMTNETVATHVHVEDDSGVRRWVHFQEYWVRMHADRPALGVRVEGIEDARAAPGVLEAIADADVIVFPPSNPVVSLGPILAVPGIRQALTDTPARIVGLSPIVGGRVVAGMADRLLPAIGVPVDAIDVGLHFGARARGGLLDGWLVDDRDGAGVERALAAGLATRAVPLMMRDVQATADMASAALDMVGVL